MWRSWPGAVAAIVLTELFMNQAVAPSVESSVDPSGSPKSKLKSKSNTLSQWEFWGRIFVLPCLGPISRIAVRRSSSVISCSGARSATWHTTSAPPRAACSEPWRPPGSATRRCWPRPGCARRHGGCWSPRCRSPRSGFFPATPINPTSRAISAAVLAFRQAATGRALRAARSACAVPWRSQRSCR